MVQSCVKSQLSPLETNNLN